MIRLTICSLRRNENRYCKWSRGWSFHCSGDHYIKLCSTLEPIGLLTSFFVIGFLLSLLMAGAFRLQKPQVTLVCYLPAALNLVLTVLSPFYGLVFHISPTNEYFRGPLFLIYVASYLFGLAFVLIWILQSLSIYQNKNKPVLFGLILLT